MKAEKKAQNLVDFVSYQKGSVVSKTLIERKTGTVTLFAFDKGQALSEHKAPYDALVCVLDGEAEITIGGEPVLVKAGEMLIMPADIPHALKAVAPFKMMLTMIRS
jgi:quercetin dioxygenase-like cupin family protein